MVGQAGGHGRRPRHPLAVGTSLTQRPYGPAEVVGVHREVGDRLMDVPVLREAVRLAGLPTVPTAVGPVLPLHKRRVDLVARVDNLSAAATAATVPKTTRKSIFTTRPFWRVL